QLTEGTLVGGVEDLSATFYNPGALALIEEPRFVIGLTSVELAKIDVPGAAGDRLDFDQTIFDIVPAVVAGQVGEGRGRVNHFAFAFLARHDFDWDIGYADARVSASAPEGAAGFGRFRQRLVEYWVGGSWSRRLSDHLSIGVSPFFAYRAQRSRRTLTLEELAGDTSREVFVGRENEYNHVRLLAKAGVAWRPGRWELGATLTAPGVKVWGNGKVVFNAGVAGEAQAPALSATIQKGLRSTYHAPWSVAGGASWRRPRGAIHTTVEWFSSVAAYDILQPDPAPVAGRSETVPLVYTGEARSVVCYGLGLEQRVRSRVLVYGGAAHNESAYVAGRDAFAAWDLTDLTTGFTFETGRAKLALGLGYAWGSKELPQAVVPPDGSGAPPMRDARFSRWTISFGTSFVAK
ncbi:MAG TPA: hypothetical protein VLF95_06935, partial [Vicinamibacteria bacterium]|nr:hypothetical protein [Vicinamibacteria bacterium]